MRSRAPATAGCADAGSVPARRIRTERARSSAGDRLAFPHGDQLRGDAQRDLLGFATTEVEADRSLESGDLVVRQAVLSEQSANAFRPFATGQHPDVPHRGT